jgi:hypothetical protein
MRMPDKIGVQYEWVDQYHDDPSVNVYRDGQQVVLSIEGVGDGTLDLIFHWAPFLSFCDMVVDTHNDLLDVIDEALADDDEEVTA